MKEKYISKNVWIFQTIPKNFRLLECLRDKKVVKNEDVWEVDNKYKNKIRKNDIGIIWRGTEDSGIYATIDIIGNPESIKASDYPSSKYYVFEEDKGKFKLRVKFYYKKILKNPIPRKYLKEIPGLKNMKIFGKVPRGTNFEVKGKEWKIISDLIEKHK